VLDALLGLDEQDLRIARLAEREGRAVVIALNKWDAVEDRVAARRSIEDTLQTSLAQLKGITVVAMSAATGRGVDKLMPAVRETMERWNKRVPTGELNRWFEGALSRHQGAAADDRDFRPACRGPAGGLPALSGEQLPRRLRHAGRADPAAAAGHQQPLRGQGIKERGPEGPLATSQPIRLTP
jgi:GTP-binding protein